MTIVFTNSKDVTADFVCAEFERQNVRWFRVDTDRTEPDVVAQNVNFLNTIPRGTNIWLRRPFEANTDKINDTVSAITESEINTYYWGQLMSADDVNWINHPANNWVAANKIIQHKYCSKAGIRMPETLVTCNQHEALKFVHSGRTIVKPLNHGYFPDRESISLIYANECSCDMNFDTVSNCPVLFQRMVENKKDVRLVYIMGELRSFELIGDNLDIRRKNMESVRYNEVVLPNDINCSYRTMMQHFNLNFCTSDYVVSENGDCFFLENNPNGQWAWIGLEMKNDLISWFATSLSHK
jgi:hypothetical protein